MRELNLNKPIVKMTTSEYKEYSSFVAKMKVAETKIELDAWYRKAMSIVNKAKARELKEIQRKAALYDMQQAENEQAATISFA